MSFKTKAVAAKGSNESEGTSSTTIYTGNRLRQQPTNDDPLGYKSEELADDSKEPRTFQQSDTEQSATSPAPQSDPDKMCYLNNPNMPAQEGSPRAANSKKCYCGLKNLGNTCYANSVLQALYITNKLRRHLLKRSNAVGPLNAALFKLFTMMEKMATRVAQNQESQIIKPDEFLNEFRTMKPQFVKHEQHDSQEFLTILLECIHQEANQAKRDNTKNIQIELRNAEEAWNHHVANVDNSYFSRLFVGQIESSLKCLTCGNVSLSWSCFWQLPLHLNDTPPGNGNEASPQATRLSIEDCIREYFASETLSDDCAPFCGKCNQRRSSTKQQSINRLPHYLIVHLKRFTYTGTKITRKVVINSQLKLCQKTFVIYSVVLHRGTESMGHYFTLSNVNNEWILFDDENIATDVSESQADSLIQEYAYICFYKAVSKTSDAESKQDNKSNM